MDADSASGFQSHPATMKLAPVLLLAAPIIALLSVLFTLYSAGSLFPGGDFTPFVILFSSLLVGRIRSADLDRFFLLPYWMAVAAALEWLGVQLFFYRDLDFVIRFFSFYLLQLSFMWGAFTAGCLAAFRSFTTENRRLRHVGYAMTAPEHASGDSP